MASLRDTLRSIIAEVGELDDLVQITDTADLYTDLDLDSMQAMEIMLEIEKQLSLSIPGEALDRVRCLNDAVAMAMELGATDDT